MSRAWSTRSAAERERLESKFVLHHGVDLLLDGQDHHENPGQEEDGSSFEGRPRPSFARLYGALHRGGPLPTDLVAALGADPALRADFSLLIERSALQHLPRAAAAASTGSLERREAGGCTLRLISSRAGDGQVYLLIELPEGDAGSSPRDRGPARRALETERDSASGREGESGEPEAAVPGRLVVKTAAGAFLMEDFPPPETRTIRLVKAADDPVVRAVGEPASEIFLL